MEYIKYLETLSNLEYGIQSLKLKRAYELSSRNFGKIEAINLEISDLLEAVSDLKDDNYQSI